MALAHHEEHIDLTASTVQAMAVVDFTFGVEGHFSFRRTKMLRSDHAGALRFVFELSHAQGGWATAGAQAHHLF